MEETGYPREVIECSLASAAVGEVDGDPVKLFKLPAGAVVLSLDGPFFNRDGLLTWWVVVEYR